MINVYDANQKLKFTTQAFGFLQPHELAQEYAFYSSALNAEFTNPYADNFTFSNLFVSLKPSKRRIPIDGVGYQRLTGLVWARIAPPCSILLLHGLGFGYPNQLRPQDLRPEIYVNNYQIGSLQKGKLNIYDEKGVRVWSSHYIQSAPKILANLEIDGGQQTHTINNPERKHLYALADPSLGIYQLGYNGADFMKGVEVIFHSDTEIETRIISNSRHASQSVPFWSIPIATF